MTAEAVGHDTAIEEPFGLEVWRQKPRQGIGQVHVQVHGINPFQAELFERPLHHESGIMAQMVYPDLGGIDSLVRNDSQSRRFRIFRRGSTGHRSCAGPPRVPCSDKSD